ncbi:MAG TPA: glycoside hydrolase domain-containing protein [Polyangiaceae bacterium]
MTYALKPIAAADGLVVDTVTKLTAGEAKALYDAGVRAVVRYCPLPGNGVGWDLTAEELAADTAAGLAVVVVQHPRAPSQNVIDEATGEADAKRAIEYCAAIGYGPGASLVLDMEGVRSTRTADAHASAWCVTARLAGYRPVIYVGYDSGLSTAQLAAMGDDVEYWCDAGAYGARPTPPRKFAWKQHMQSTLAGVGVDRDDVLVDGAVVGWVAVQDVVLDPADPTQPMPPLPFSPDTQPPGAA